MGYGEVYGSLLKEIAEEADAIATRYFRGEELRVDRKGDGTEEFSRGIPTFGTLMGIESNGEIVAAMVSAPGLHSRWWAYRGEGAYRDGTQLHVSNVTSLGKAMVFTTGTGPSKNAHDQAKIRALLDAARNSRSFGGFWQHMLVAEGGGRSTNVHGERTIYTGQLISTNGKIHDEVLAILRRSK